VVGAGKAGGVKLTKQQREALRAKYEGRCAYCGEQLGDRWHADHLEPVRREWWKKEGGMERPENDHLANLMPACAPCNIDKHAMSLEEWRKKLERAPEVLTRNNPTYRHALRFGLVCEMGSRVVFLFECTEAA
jgi:5-methylcytosine-specific restriction endonuclease McrA